MQPEHRIDFRILQHASLDHRLRTAPAVRRAFFRGLEEELHRARERGLHAGQHFCRTHQNRDVVVMSARVHDADVLTVVRSAHLGLERQVHLLRDGQTVHVGPQRHNRSRLSAAQNANDAVHATDFRLHLHAECPQMRRNQRRRTHLIPGKLRMLMNVPPPADHLRHHRERALLDVVVHRLHIHRTLRQCRRRQHADAECASQEKPYYSAHRRLGSRRRRAVRLMNNTRCAAPLSIPREASQQADDRERNTPFAPVPSARQSATARSCV